MRRGEEHGRIRTMQPSGDEPAKTLYTALWQLVEPGATLEATASQQILLELACARGSEPDAPVERRAQLAREEIINACQALDEPNLAVEPRWQRQGGAVLALFGLATG